MKAPMKIFCTRLKTFISFLRGGTHTRASKKRDYSKTKRTTESTKFQTKQLLPKTSRPPTAPSSSAPSRFRATGGGGGDPRYRCRWQRTLLFIKYEPSRLT